MVIWLNSSLNILQMLLNRTETRGAWMKLHQYQIRSSLIPKLKIMTQEDRNNLLALYERLRTVEFPSILDQLRGRFKQRVEIDKAMLKMLGHSEHDANQVLDYLYPALTYEIEKLKTLMEG